MSLLQQLDIFELRPLITNLSCKLSTVSEYETHKQLLCLVTEENDIVLRYTSDANANSNNGNGAHVGGGSGVVGGGNGNFQEVLKLISWFRRTSRVIHDVCFDPTGCWLLVLCFDNTLHIVPALAVVDKNYSAETQQPQQPFSITQVTSYIIPFVGPHECPNSKKCPNHSTSLNTSNNHANKRDSTLAVPIEEPVDDEFVALAASGAAAAGLAQPNGSSTPKLALGEDVVVLPLIPKEQKQQQQHKAQAEPTLEAFSHDVPDNMLVPAANAAAVAAAQPAVSAASTSNVDKTGNSQMMATSFMASKTCPFPLSVVWWQTIDGQNRAVIGYSDGSICFVGLSPNCPFVASTAIESGSVVKLLLCKDTTFESVMLLITSSLKQQFKLLLEQKAIKYVYPGDTSPSTGQPRESDWQIVMPLKPNTSNCSDPASDSSTLDEDVFISCEEASACASSNANTTKANINITRGTTQNNALPNAVAVAAAIATSQMPPPPPYSVAVSRNAESATINTTAAAMTSVATTNSTNNAATTTNTTASTAATAAAGVRFQQQQNQQQQQLSTVEDFYANDGSSNSSNNNTNISTSTGNAATTTVSDNANNTGGNGSVGGNGNGNGGGSGTGGGGGGGGGAGSAGILPAARARLASLRSLGSKKFNAIKMRLTDNRQKLEEYMPENTLGSSFAIMDSPSLTPELLATSAQGSFYTIQNLLSTYLLSALHAQSNSLSVHSIDINLKPLFLYKIPRNCYDILISSNILYSIQYVDIESASDSTPAANATQPMGEGEGEATAASTSASTSTAGHAHFNTEKENRDTDIEKLEKYAEVEVLDLSEDDDKLMLGAAAAPSGVGSSSVETSATSSGPSITTTSTATNNLVNAVGVISSAMASLRTGMEDKFNASSQLGLFRFENETVISLYQMATFRAANDATEILTKEEKAQAFAYKDIHSPMDYVHFYGNATHVQDEFSLRQMEIMQNEFPRINYDPCYVVTNRNVYYIQLKKEPFAIFLDAALAGEWTQCREFCTTFDLSYESCIEFAGDYLLRRKKVTQALVTYNAARIKPIRTALKLAMFGQTNALMHLCAMALKTTYTLSSKYFCNPILKTLLTDITYRHSEDVRHILPPSPATYVGLVNDGMPCSDYTYGVDEILSNLQMSPSSQFHLANLLLITLAEKAVNDKNYLPLWNFLCTNTKYHTNMTSIVLCQSGLFSAALILAKTRGVCIDTFLALTSVVGQEFGWYTELNVCLYNLSEPMFAETITYVPHIAADYFNFIQEKIDCIRPCVLKRLEEQLNPFSATLRPIVSHTSPGRSDHNVLNDVNSSEMFTFCKTLIETYLAVLLHMESQRCKRDHIANALSTFRINYEDNQFAIETSRFKPISAGCVHCACVVDGVAYFWGSNGVPCNYSVNKSADPPEPAHAVKGLDLLAQLNLEVHTVKCGRQHSLILTNNGLYSFGNNNFCQLGVGKQLQMSLQPMLVKEFDGKNITILEAGQYHNAAVADGQLYTWGWGVYGQLGHGDTEDLAEPKAVEFFKQKQILQVSLGHAHSLVLCNGPLISDGTITTELYVFGSNHFGQLGIGGAPPGSSPSGSGADELDCTSQVKSLVPLKLDVCDARIRLIHTKFFTNLAVDEEERMYTWGSSPQALRLANQIKRRANAKQKLEEHQRREMSKRFEATTCDTPPSSTATTTAILTTDVETDDIASLDNASDAPTTNALANSELAMAKAVEDAPISDGIQPCDFKGLAPHIRSTASDDNEELLMNSESNNDTLDVIDGMERCKISEDTAMVGEGVVADSVLEKRLSPDGMIEMHDTKDEATAKQNVTLSDSGGKDVPDNSKIVDVNVAQSSSDASVDIRTTAVEDGQTQETKDEAAREQRTLPKGNIKPEKYIHNIVNQIVDSCDVLDDDMRSIDECNTKSKVKQTKSSGKSSAEQRKMMEEKRTDTAQQKQPSVEVDPCEHMSPHLVDTSEVAGQILQISSGLFHHALISSTCTLYTWGKNLEHQLGTEDKERRPVNKPSPIDSIERPMYVDCGADFTLVMTTEYVVKAFGGNSNGQCGRDLGPTIDKLKQRVVCLPASKRLMRFESQCVEVPVEINLPRPRIRLDLEPVRYMKSIPRYQPHFVQEASLSLADVHFEERPSPSQQYQSTTQAESSENVLTGQDSDDLISSLENLSNNDASSLTVSLNVPPVATTTLLPPPTSTIKTEEQPPDLLDEGCDAQTPVGDVQFLPHTHEQSSGNNNNNNKNNINNNNNNTNNNNTQSSITMEQDESVGESGDLQQLRNYIHYCLYVFHGLYNPDKVREFSRSPRLEYRIRTHMLNFKFVDAFTLCLQACDTPVKTLKLFEYFSKDATGCVPMRRQDMKFLIYYLLMHFLAHKFDMAEAEQYFLADLDYYLLELAYVLYFNNNNTVLEQELNQKFRDLIAPQPSTNSFTNSMHQQHLQQQHQHQSITDAQVQHEPPESEHKLEDTDVIFDSLSVKFKTIVCQRLLKHCGNSN